MRKWFFIWVLIPIFAHAFIGGGVRMSAKDYPFVQKVDFPKSGDCTMTLLSPLWITTAAHCVSKIIEDDETKIKTFQTILEPGMALTPVGIVEKVEVHPDFKANMEEIARLKNLQRELNPIEKKAYVFFYNNAHDSDLALIKLKENTMSLVPTIFPKLPTPQSEFTDNQVTLIGFGATASEWGQNEKGEYGMQLKQNHFDRLSLNAGKNQWVCKPPKEAVSDLEKIGPVVQRTVPSLKLQTTVTHRVRSPMETSYASGAYAMPGDSGGPALESLADGQIVISAVAATMSSDFKGFVLEIKNKQTNEIKRVAMDPAPKNWGDARLSDQSYPELLKVLEAQNITLNENIIIHREYQEQVTNRYTNLLSPKNFSFLKQKLKDYPELFHASIGQK